MKKKIKIIILCILISSMTLFTNNQQVFIIDSKNLIGIILTILGLSFTSFSFVSASIQKILDDKEKIEANIKTALQRMLNSIEEDIFFIFYAILILIFINISMYIDFPLISDPKNIDFNLFIIPSLKKCVLNFLTSLLTCLSLYSFYDLMKASFKLLKKNYY